MRLAILASALPFYLAACADSATQHAEAPSASVSPRATPGSMTTMPAGAQPVHTTSGYVPTPPVTSGSPLSPPRAPAAAGGGKVTLTPLSQGKSANELRITADIRKALMSDTSLSSAAQNAEIITVGTTVTLRGSVSSVGERFAVEHRAYQAFGVTDVVNQLDVK